MDKYGNELSRDVMDKMMKLQQRIKQLEQDIILKSMTIYAKASTKYESERERNILQGRSNS